MSLKATPLPKASGFLPIATNSSRRLSEPFNIRFTGPKPLFTGSKPPYCPKSSRNYSTHILITPKTLVIQPHVIQHRHSSTTTYYRRKLPESLHALTSNTGRTMFRSALSQGTAEAFFSLSGNFTMQSEPAFCGLGSLTMVLNALEVDPGKRWKGVWRWYSDDMLVCTAPLDQIKTAGMTYEEVAQTARCNGLLVEKHPSRSSIDIPSDDAKLYKSFIEHLAMVCKSKECHMIVSFCRKSLQQTGDGHFSPIAAYDAETNMVLVMDTARFKYPSYFVDAKMLWDAMKEMGILLPNTRCRYRSTERVHDSA